MKKFRKNRGRPEIAAVIPALVMVFLLTSCIFMKMNPPADADKAFLPGNNTCYLATAANMLAAAGYGDGATLQARSEDIYGDLTGQFGTANSGWTDAALSWWLGSTNNTWAGNPYTVVTVYGNKIPKYPWANSNGARDIANEFRNCNLVGLSISWPTDAVNPGGNPVIGSGGHAITGWGDRSWLPWNDRNDPINSNPSRLRVTDSDRETDGDIQEYNYDSYTSPNPGGANEGNGWYCDYDNNHPYIKHIIVLSPTQTAAGVANTQRVVGSYRIHQDRESDATDLHYRVGTDTEILSYNTTVSWDLNAIPEVDENQPQRDELDVKWDFTDNPIPTCKWVTITTEFILRNWNAISYEDVHFTYPDGVAGELIAPVSWEVLSPKVQKAASIPNVTGGYLIAAYDIMDPSKTEDKNMVGQYRLLHQYSYNQSPERHTLVLKGKKGYNITNLRIGHTYGYLKEQALWEFQEWMTRKDDKKYMLGEEPIRISIDWTDKLPYPKGEDIEKRIPDIRKGKLKELPDQIQKP
ncbi:MAG: hypothetical protein V5A59_09375 [Bacteroidales bacterium]|nr:hypothetical protein [Bacteroidales bacterium]